MVDIAKLPTDEYEGLFREPRPSDFYLAWVVLLLGITAAACILLVPWMLAEAYPESNLSFYAMSVVAPAASIGGLVMCGAFRRRFRSLRPETSPRKMVGAGFVLSFIPIIFGILLVIALGMTSGR